MELKNGSIQKSGAEKPKPYFNYTGLIQMIWWFLNWLSNPRIVLQSWIHPPNNQANPGVGIFARSLPLGHFPRWYSWLLNTTLFLAKLLLICKRAAMKCATKENGSYQVSGLHSVLWSCRQRFHSFPQASQLFEASSQLWKQHKLFHVLSLPGQASLLLLNSCVSFVSGQSVSLKDPASHTRVTYMTYSPTHTHIHTQNSGFMKGTCICRTPASLDMLVDAH